MFISHRLSRIIVPCLMVGVLLPTSVALANATKPKTQPAAALASLWKVGQNGALQLTVAGQSDPVTVATSPNTLIAGPCHDCGESQPFKVADAAKSCDKCMCNRPNAVCVAWKEITPTVGAMLQALPRGMVLLITYNLAGQPESGLKSLSIDHRGVLLKVDGIAALKPAQLASLAKTVGGSRAELLNDGHQLSFITHGDWTTAQESKFEQELAKVGGKVAFEPAGRLKTRLSTSKKL